VSAGGDGDGVAGVTIVDGGGKLLTAVGGVGDDNDATADGGGSEGCETTDEKDGELKLLIHPRSGRIAESEDDGAAADDDGGEGCATVEPLKLVFFAFFAGLVAAAEVFTFEYTICNIVLLLNVPFRETNHSYY
jgi:hypothetical protein